MSIQNNNLGKVFGPSPSFAGYVMIIAGILSLSRSLWGLALIIPGAFLAFTYTGTMTDYANRRVRYYTSFFGLISTGKWTAIDQTAKLNILKVRRKMTSYSRANVRLDTEDSEIRLVMLNKNGTEKIILNRYNTFEDARKEKERITLLLADPQSAPHS
jgi:hypothetical protein